ncbi:IS607 family transposase, partial [Campylobacter jejuni]|nr:MerR family DNA-binding transcriptional regulator [Campylobacter jejuni]EDK9199841.1 IS607 family transposase [Campylobacter jejuni]EKY8179399.1 MerR family DNA-binding transcriptional regulator [Campylobacter jejuni]
MNKLISIGHAANLLGVTIQTIRNWDKQGFLKP